MDSTTWNLRIEALKREMNDDPFFGPYIVANGKSGSISDRLNHTGYSIQVVTASHKIDAEILRVKTSFWFTPEQLIVSRYQLNFSFPQLQQEHIPFLDLLHVLVSMRAKPINIPDLLIELEPLLGEIRKAPLKRNAHACMVPKYRELGLATAPVKLTKSQAVVRIVWLFPSDRKGATSARYLPVATIKVAVNKEGHLGKADLAISDWNKFFRELTRYVAKEDHENPMQMLSSEGKQELETAIRSRLEGGHPRTMLQQKREALTMAHTELWNSPLELGLMLQKEGLYGAKVTKLVLKEQAAGLISSAKSGGGGNSKPARNKFAP